MPAPLAVDKEAVRVLVVAVGVTEAARQTGIDLSTVKQWSARGKWLAHTRAEPPKLPLSMQPTIVTGVTKAADALVNTLRDRHLQTRLGLSKWSATASTKLGELEGEEALAAAPTAKLTADVAARVWPEQQQASQGVAMVLNISVLGAAPSQGPALDGYAEATDLSGPV